MMSERHKINKCICDLHSVLLYSYKVHIYLKIFLFHYLFIFTTQKPIPIKQITRI